MTLVTLTDKDRLELLREIASELSLDPQNCTGYDILRDLEEVIWKARNYDWWDDE